MNDISLEKIDIVRERTGVTYREAKDALEKTNGDVVEALILLEDGKTSSKDQVFNGFDDFKTWLKEIVDKGNVTRIRVKKDDKTVLNVPVTAGVAVGFLTILWWPFIAAIGVVTAVVTKITVEVVKEDGSVEVVNTIIKNATNDVKDKVDEFTSDVKDKVDNISSDVKNKFDGSNKTKVDDDSNVYQYTVNFEDVDDNQENAQGQDGNE